MEQEGLAYIMDAGHARVVEQPKDGHCLFHALCWGLNDGSAASLLRLQISKYIIDHPDMTVGEASLGDWVSYDSGACVTTYAARMAGDTWGGAIEMQAFAEMKGVAVHVYERSKSGFRRTFRFNATTGESLYIVRVLYNGHSHYDALEERGAQGKWLRVSAVAADGGA
jgi:hypothetical protein